MALRVQPLIVYCVLLVVCLVWHTPVDSAVLIESATAVESATSSADDAKTTAAGEYQSLAMFLSNRSIVYGGELGSAYVQLLHVRLLPCSNTCLSFSVTSHMAPDKGSCCSVCDSQQQSLSRDTAGCKPIELLRLWSSPALDEHDDSALRHPVCCCCCHCCWCPMNGFEMPTSHHRTHNTTSLQQLNCLWKCPHWMRLLLLRQAPLSFPQQAPQLLILHPPPLPSNFLLLRRHPVIATPARTASHQAGSPAGLHSASSSPHHRPGTSRAAEGNGRQAQESRCHEPGLHHDLQQAQHVPQQASGCCPDLE